MTPLPLHGVRVLDLTHVLAGPYTASLLGDLGADVVKVEPTGGDVSRSIGPRRVDGMSAQFVSINRNKRALTIDLKQEAAQEVFARLVRTAHVVVTNMRASALERLGVDYRSVAAIAPAIVYCHIVGFASDHPLAGTAAIDDAIQARSGLASLQELVTGRAGYVAYPAADMTAALFAALGVVAALYRRAATGHGEEIEVPLYDSLASLLMTVHMSGSVFEPPLGPPVYPRSVMPARRPFRTADGAVSVAAYMDRDWVRLLTMLGKPELLEDERFATVYARSSNFDELYALIEPEFELRTTAEWLAAFAEADIAAAPVQTTAQLLDDNALAARLFPVVEDDHGDAFRLVQTPIRFADAPADPPRPSPRLGQHTVDILVELGFDRAEIDLLVESGAVLAESVAGCARN